MNFGYSVGDIIAISKLAVKVYTAYREAPNDYRNISDEVVSLHIIINKTAQYFESTTLSHDEQQNGQKVLKGCENVLKDLDSLIEKYQGLASIGTSQVLRRVKLGTEDITTLRARLISNTGLLNSFIQSCGLGKMEAPSNEVVGLHRTSSTISFGSINTRNVYKNFCKGLFGIGVTAEMIGQKEGEIHEIFKPSNTVTGGQIHDTIVGQGQLQEQGSNSSAKISPISTDRVLISTNIRNRNRSRFSWIRPPPMDFIVGPLMLAAAEAGNLQRLISTLKYIRDINVQDGWKETALHKAADRGYKDIVQQLLMKGASTEAIDVFNVTPLHLAAENGHTSTVELLLIKGASIEAADYRDNTPLHFAARNGHSSTVVLLLTKGAPIEAMNHDNNTPLYLAASKGHVSTVKLLLTNGASIEVSNYENNPLHLAASNGHTRTVELLLAKGASINITNHCNNTPLHLAASKGHTSTVELLLMKGASIDVTNYCNNTPLHLAASKGHTSVVKLLLMKGASIEATNYSYNTPLHFAARGGYTSTVELLLIKGALIEATSNSNNTPLHLAARGGYTSTVELLLTKGASIEATNYSYNTPLHLAARGGYISTVEIILMKGASIEIMNEDNNTPLHLAAQGGRTDVVKLLESRAVKPALLGRMRTLFG